MLFPYRATNLDEVSLQQSERVEVLDNTNKWWVVRNRMGAKGFAPSNLLEMVQSKPFTSRGDAINHYCIIATSMYCPRAGADGLINLSGKLVPAPPMAPPPPPPMAADKEVTDTHTHQQILCCHLSMQTLLDSSAHYHTPPTIHAQTPVVS